MPPTDPLRQLLDTFAPEYHRGVVACDNIVRHLDRLKTTLGKQTGSVLSQFGAVTDHLEGGETVIHEALASPREKKNGPASV